MSWLLITSPPLSDQLPLLLRSLPARCSWTNQSGASVSFDFIGTQIKVFVSRRPVGTYLSNASFSIDGGVPTFWTTSDPVNAQSDRDLVYTSRSLSPTQHLITVTNFGAFFWFDYMEFTVASQPPGGNPTTEATPPVSGTSTTTTSRPPASTAGSAGSTPTKTPATSSASSAQSSSTKISRSSAGATSSANAGLASVRAMQSSVHPLKLFLIRSLRRKVGAGHLLRPQVPHRPGRPHL
ncbi:hypothetical protein BV20DRAFT_87030 [Pilatotrama ljubarskyi]|nr:hypothetical protein BV20DRAFT_87030 [Pilatotrama ljubarskyi]